MHAEWDAAALKDILGTVKEELGLPPAAGLTAEFHSLLVYEPNQFFLAHQDSEKSDSVGTLVVTLPYGYAGGELMVEHDGERRAYRGSKTALSLIAFSDCRHEVLRVRSGYRITLTYNLLLHNTNRPGGDDATVTELAASSASTSARRYPGITAVPRPIRRTGSPTSWTTSTQPAAVLAAAERRGREPGAPTRTAAGRAAVRPSSRSPISRRRTARRGRRGATDTRTGTTSTTKTTKTMASTPAARVATKASTTSRS